MEELINKKNQLIKEVVETLPNIQRSIDDTTKNYQYYIGSIKNEVFKIKDNETYSEAIKRGEGIFDRIDETERRRKIVIEKSQETINQIEIMKNKMSRIIEECKSDEETLSKTRNELIDKIISIEEMVMKNKLFRKPKETDKITAEFNKKKEGWKTYYTDYLERKRRQEEERRKEEEERRQQQEEEERRQEEEEEERKRQEEEEERRQEEEEEERKRQEEEEERKKQEQERKIQEHERKIQEYERKIKEQEEERNKQKEEQDRKIQEQKEEQDKKIQEHERKIQEQERKTTEQEKKIQQLEKLRIIKEGRKEEMIQIMKGMNTIEEIRQIEEWTNRKVEDILFDSDIDNWNKNTSVFDQRIMNKEHIIIIIEDEEGNKFGGYVNSKIDKVGYINDSQSFVFSLESNGRIEGMKKFDIRLPLYAFCLSNQSDNCLFALGLGDILVCKENNKTESFCSQHSFDYKRISNALCGKQLPERFTPKRIIVIEMK
ncbi:TLD, putative [Entamoeba histolytica]